MLTNEQCIEKLVVEYGLTEEELIERFMWDSLVPAVCKECGSTYEYEPDCTGGHCEECGAKNVESLLFLVGMV
jgi:predicted Zn-ribbon and HTH transcriptional regulator